MTINIKLPLANYSSLDYSDTKHTLTPKAFVIPACHDF